MAKEFQQTEWDEQVVEDCRRLIRLAVLEDLDRGHDWTTVSLVPREAEGRAALVARKAGVIAGLVAMPIIIDEMDRKMQFEAAVQDGKNVADGTAVEQGAKLGMVSGPARSLLTAERLFLNFVGRLSGIATLTQSFVKAVAGTGARIYDTRKTTPGWRRLEKYAVRQGGGHNHRTGLFDAVLIKDNHLALGGAAMDIAHFSPVQAVQHARQFILENFPADDPRRQMIVEVEVDSTAQLEQVLPERPDIVLLDNMSLENLREAVAMRNRLAPGVELEASGGVNLTTVRGIAETGVDRISAGALTHSAIALDVGLDWVV